LPSLVVLRVIPVATTACASLPIVSPEIVMVTAALAATVPPVKVTVRDVAAILALENVRLELATLGAAAVENKPDAKVTVITWPELMAPPTDGVNTIVAETAVLAAVESTEAIVMDAVVTLSPTAGAETSASLPSRVVCMVSAPDGFGPNAVLPIFKPVMVSVSKSVLPDFATRGAGDTDAK
jgi:hypothetical protein